MIHTIKLTTLKSEPITIIYVKRNHGLFDCRASHVNHLLT